MSTRLTPRNRRENRGHYRENSRERKSNNRNSRGRKSKSPRRRSSSRSLSPRRSDRRRIQNRSSSPRRGRAHNESRSPPRKEQRYKGGRSRSKGRSSRSVRRKRHTERRDERTRRSRKERRHRRSTSASRSPVRRSRRRRDYSSSSSKSSSNSSSPETEYHHRRRRKRRREKRRRPMLYRVGDIVEFKKGGSRRRRSRWVPVEICRVHQDGMYGEVTYTVWLFHSRRVVDYVHSDELRFKYDDLQRRRGHDEMAYFRGDLRRGEYYRRGRRMGGGRERSQARTWHSRAQSADRNRNILASHDNNQGRATSVPPENRNWGAFLADFAKAVYRDQGGDRDFNNDEQWQTVADEIATPVGRFRHNDKHFDEIEHRHQYRGDNYRLANRNRGLGTDEHTNFQGNRPTYNIKGREAQGRDINLNVQLPVIPACQCKNERATNVESD